MKKKNVNIVKTKIFLQKYPIIIFLQHNNLAVKNWSQLRTPANGIKTGNIFVFKNTIMETILLNDFFDLKNLNSKKIQFLFQGPSVAVGCKDMIELKETYNFLNSMNNLLILGAIYSNNVLNHLDLEKLLSLNFTTYNLFLTSFTGKDYLYNTLQESTNLDYLSNIKLNLYSCLLTLEQKLKDNLYMNSKGVNPTAGSPTVTLLRLRSSY